MGDLEDKSKKRRRNESLRAILLGSVAVAGALSIALVAPNVLGGMKRLGLFPKPRQTEYIAAARRRLKRQGYLEEQNGHLYLTSKGEKYLRSLALVFAKVPPPKRWDGKWRVLIFDIPEQRRHIRFRIREHLREIGFVHMQHSVWVYPYPCEEFIALLKTELRVGRDMKYLIVDSIEGDGDLRSTFKLASAETSPLRTPTALDPILDVILPRK